MSSTRALADWFFRHPQTGQLTVAQPPNPAIATWALASIAALVWDERATELRWIATGALVVWAADELLRGGSPFRRVLGGGVYAYRVWQLSSDADATIATTRHSTAQAGILR